MAKINQEEILHETREDEVANLNPRTRIVGMKWRRLGVDQDPEWDRPVFLFEPPETFCNGKLSGIHLSPTGKVFTFTDDDSITWANTFTHYCIPTIPK